MTVISSIQRFRWSTVLRVALAVGGVSLIAGDARIFASLVLGAVVMFWHGVDTGRLAGRLLLDRAMRHLAPAVPLVLAVVGAGLPLVVPGREGLLVQLFLPTAVGVAALRAGYAVADGGWRWRAFAWDLGYGASGWVAVALIAVCGVPWGGAAGVIAGGIVAGALWAARRSEERGPRMAAVRLLHGEGS
jgi:hypothetical protein